MRLVEEEEKERESGGGKERMNKKRERNISILGWAQGRRGQEVI